MGRFNWDWSGEGPPRRCAYGAERFSRCTWGIFGGATGAILSRCSRLHGPDVELERRTLARPMVKLTRKETTARP